MDGAIIRLDQSIPSAKVPGAPGTHVQPTHASAGTEQTGHEPAQDSLVRHDLGPTMDLFAVDLHLCRLTISCRAAQNGMPLDAVARASGISHDRLLAIFRGDFDPDLGLVGRIAEVLGVTAADLLAEPDFN